MLSARQSLPVLLPQSRLLGPFRSSENCPFSFTPDLLIIVAIPWDGSGYVYGDYDHIYQTSSCVVFLVRCQGERTRARLRHMDRHRQLECIWSASVPCVLQLQLAFEKEVEACKRRPQIILAKLCPAPCLIERTTCRALVHILISAGVWFPSKPTKAEIRTFVRT